ncbi:hypothetical protein AWN76_006910 [Rhodothermaceae bacterium RA]|nr:hypothetical protein AWN76_006910 [Rhodothermaceae bacterium RA]
MKAPAFLRRLFRPPLSCEDVNRFIVAYLDDALPDRLRTRFEAHLAHCANCSAYLAQYRQTIALVREAEQLPPPPAELADLTLAFLHRHLDAPPPDEDAAAPS